MTSKLAFLLLLLAVFSRDIVGVSPENQTLYTPDKHGKWHCLLDPSIELDFNQVNDDFCDCLDGSDEPGTNACPFTEDEPRYFYCANKGYKPAYIENYKVNDGVCDYDICCDGSDEWKSGGCQNVCEQVQAQFDQFLAHLRLSVSKALNIKNGLQKKAQSLKELLVKSADSLAKEIQQDRDALEFKKSELAAQKSLLEDTETTSNESVIKLLVLEHLQKLEQKVAQWREYSKKATENVQRLETMLNNLLENYNPNFNDQAVKQAVAAFGDYVSNKPESQKEPVWDVSDLSLEKISLELKHQVVSSPKTAVGDKSRSLFGKWLGKGQAVLGNSAKDSAPNDMAQEKAAVSGRLKHLSDEIDSLEKKLNQKIKEHSIYQDGISQEFGPAGIYRAVKGKWINKQIGEYTYKLGFLDSLYQDDTLVGRFQGVQDQTMFFAHGSKCWNGPQRSATVDMVCGTDHELISVSEPEKCQYRFVMYSPLACEDISDEKIGEKFVVDKGKLRI